jgi:hypothetical protein
MHTGRAGSGRGGHQAGLAACLPAGLLMAMGGCASPAAKVGRPVWPVPARPVPETGIPAGGPAGLLEVGIGWLSVPVLRAVTAPPRGSDSIVGLPEWYWVPSGGWHPVSVTIRARPVWATATARPTTLTCLRGGLMGAVRCPGPGTSFKRSLPAAEQRTNCSYTYLWPSTGQRGSAFRAGVFVTWTISWTGSGGLITGSFRTGTAFAVRVAQAAALVTKP